MPSLLLGALLLGAAPTPRIPSPASTVMLDLDRSTLSGADGTLHGGAVVSYEAQTTAVLVLGPGRYTVEILASATNVDDEPALLDLRLDDVTVVQLAIPPDGLEHRVRGSFEVSDARARSVSLAFVNDLYEDGQDRNVSLDRFRLVRVSAPDTEARAELLRSTMQGSNLVLVSLDTLRADHLSTYGYARHTSPHIDALADQGIRFDDARSSSHWTAPSHATMLTGLHPTEHGVVDPPERGRMSEKLVTLAETLEDAGYRTGAFTESFFVTQLLGLHQGFSTWQEQPATCEETVRDATRWMADQQVPFFLFVHTYQTHAPYDPPAPYDQMFTPDGPLPARAVEGQFRGPGDPPTPEELTALVGLYDGEIRTADACVGQLVAALEAAGQEQDTLVVVTSDHGEEFMEHGSFGHGRLYPDLLHVPLVFSHPL
ncbi:MAG: sulfatase-like hydrolase/transferase, partial [Myxococcota bacterium]|nr:sulfatase-like hydrolase/transferase [Myxococcota bacterium]